MFMCSSQYGALIREHIKEGIIVPMEVTIKLLENAMQPVGQFLSIAFALANSECVITGCRSRQKALPYRRLPKKDGSSYQIR